MHGVSEPGGTSQPTLAARLRRTFAVGWVAGLAAFLPMIAWARNIEPGGAAAWPLLSAIEAAYVGLFAILVAGALRYRWAAVPALALGWVGLEAVRGSFPSGGFGWGELSYAHVDGSWLLPMARIGGHRLITLAVALVGALLFEAWRQSAEAVEGLEGSRLDRTAAMLPHGQRPMFAVAGVLMATLLATVEPPATPGSTDVLVVQGNDMERPDVTGRALDLLIAETLLTLTQDAIGEGPTPDVVVWPESSIDRDAWQPGNEDLLEVVRAGAALADGGLLVGVKLDGDRPDTFRNTVIHVDRDGQPVETYVKRNLVPFGEYLPLRFLLDDVGPLRAVGEDGQPGDGPVHLAPTDDLDVAIAICFETLFGATVRDNVLGNDGTPAGLVVAATNDASFGRGAEVDQHLDQSRMRAVETGRWVVHAAISGSSAFVDPRGRLHDRTDVFELAVLRRDVPVAEGRTPYLAVGDLVTPLGLLALAVTAILPPVARRRRARAAADGPDTPTTQDGA